MIPLLQMKTADTAHMGIFAGPFPDFWVGPGYEASVKLGVVGECVVSLL